MYDFKKSHIVEWKLNKEMNPLTHQKIMPTSKIYQHLEKLAEQDAEKDHINEEIILKPNQKSIIQKLIKSQEKKLFFINDKVGSGKTNTFLYFMSHIMKSEDKVLIVANRTLQEQWKQDIETFFPNNFCYYSVYFSTSKIKSDFKIIFKHFNLVFITKQDLKKNSFYKNFFSHINYVCFDEIDNFDKCFLINVNRIKFFVLSADPYESFWKICKLKSFKDYIFHAKHSLEIYSDVCYQAPETEIITTEHIYQLSNNVKSIKEFVSPEIFRHLKENNIEDLIKKSEDKNLISWVIQLKEFEISELEKLQNGSLVEKARREEKINKIKKEITILKNRKEENEQICNICFNDLKEEKKQIFVCCQNFICNECLKHIKNTCPFCRNKDLVSIGLKNFSITTISLEQIIFQISNKLKFGKNIIFFCTTDLRKIIYQLEESFNIFRIQGYQYKRSIIIEEFNSPISETTISKILVLSDTENYYGLRLHGASDLIILNCNNPEQRNQIIGRAIRLGRTLPILNIYDVKAEE